MRTAHYDDAAENVEFGQVSVFLAPAFVIAVRRSAHPHARTAAARYRS